MLDSAGNGEDSLPHLGFAVRDLGMFGSRRVLSASTDCSNRCWNFLEFVNFVDLWGSSG